MDKDLLLNVQSKFGREISTQRDIHQLKDDIFFLTTHHIGFNTLRRFFGFLDYVEPSRKTLIILSNYVGYRSYEAFLRRNVVDHVWEGWSKIIDISYKKNLNNEDLIWLKSCRNTPNYYLFLVRLINQYMSDKKIDSLNKIFSDPILFEMPRAEISKLATLFYINKKENSLKDLKEFSPLFKCEIFKQLTLFIYVDYDRYNFQYGKILQLANPYLKKEDEVLFSKLFINLCDNLNNKKIRLYPNMLKLPVDCHPILYGRYMVMTLFHNDSIENYNLLLAEAKKQKDKILYFQEVIFILMIMKRLDYLESIFDLYYDDLFSYRSWDQIMIERYNILALALVHIKRKNLKQCAQTLSFFNEEKQIHSNNKIQTIFYSIANFYLLKQKKSDKQMIEETKDLYVKTVKETKFRMFTLKYLKTYFN